MKADLLVKNFPKTQILEEYFLKETEKLFRRFKNLNLDSLSLRCEIEKNPHREEYFSKINLHVPKRTITSQERAKTALSSLKKSFKILKEQLDKTFKKRNFCKKRGS